MQDWARSYLDHIGDDRKGFGSREWKSTIDYVADDRGFASRGSDVVVWPLAKIVRAGAIRLGSHVIIDDFVFLDGGAGTRIGDFVHVAVGAVICGGGELEVGDFSNIASGARVYTGTDDVLGGLVGPTIPAKFRSVTRAKTTIGRHVQILANAVIHAGAQIPDGVIVAPGSVVTVAAAERMLSWYVYGGVTTRILHARDLRLDILAAEARLRESLRG